MNARKARFQMKLYCHLVNANCASLGHLQITRRLLHVNLALLERLVHLKVLDRVILVREVIGPMEKHAFPAY